MGTRCVARNARHPGTRPEQPAIESMALITNRIYEALSWQLIVKH